MIEDTEGGDENEIYNHTPGHHLDLMASEKEKVTTNVSGRVENGTGIVDTEAKVGTAIEKREKDLEQLYLSSPQVIISHGANQVNATRDATRHAECIAIDRMLTGGLVSDKLRLPEHVFLKKRKKKTGDSSSVLQSNQGVEEEEENYDHYNDKWRNIPSESNHWKNSYGWGTGRLYKREIFKKCDLYVTCEPCIMVSLY